MLQNLAQESLCARVTRMSKDRLWCPLLLNNPLIDKDHSIRDLSGKGHFMGYDDYSHAFVQCDGYYAREERAVV